MADKEATIYIVDIGHSMCEHNNGREESDLDYCMRYVWDKITTTVSSGRKTAKAGVVALRSDATKNELADAGDETMEHISVLHPISQVLMSDLRRFKDSIKPSGTEEGDAISSIILAIQMIEQETRHLKYVKTIYLVTNGLGPMDDDGIDDIVTKLKDDGIQLTVLGVDFDDPEYGFKEEHKNSSKARNEEILCRLTGACDGTFGTMEEAVSQLSIPRVKPVRPVTSFRGKLSLGNAEEYDTAMEIDVERYPKIMIGKPPSASQFVIKADMAPEDANMASTADVDPMDVDGLAAVKNARVYQVDDPEAPGGKRDVETDELAKGYNYGSTAVHISESEWNVTKLEENAAKCLSILGFVDEAKYKRYFHMSKTNQIIAQRGNDKASMALSALIHALLETASYAVARFISKEGKDPLLIILAPSIEPDYECLIDVELPFAEDIRQYRFPPLDRVVTVSGKNLFEHRNLPSSELMDAMGQYVEDMDLSTFDKDGEGNPMEYAALENTYSPVLHRIEQALRYRAAHPDKGIQPPAEILLRYSQPPAELAQQAQNPLVAVMKAADVKKVPPKVKGRKRAREIDKPLSGLDIGALLGTNKRVKISSENAIPEFKQLLETSEDPSIIKTATKQLGEIIEDYVRHSVGDSGYKRAIEAIRVFRKEMVEFEEPAVFNEWLRIFKEKVLGGDMGGERREMWWLVRSNKLSLLHKGVSEVSDVTEEEAKEFMSVK